MSDELLPPLLVTPEALDRLLRADLSIYKSNDEHAALRGALGTAAGLCDHMSAEIAAQNKKRGRINRDVRRIAAAFKRCGDEIWRMRERIKP